MTHPQKLAIEPPPEARVRRCVTSETRRLLTESRPKARGASRARTASPGYCGSESADNDIYRQLVADVKARYKISIRKWHTRMAGVAYELQFQDGRIKRLIAAPRPRSPVSAAIFLHEVGHHAIGFHRYSQRCLEEYYVWQWALREMTARQIPIDDRVLRHYRRSMQHYIRLAQLHGHDIPREIGQCGFYSG
jgi:hypothetical protein